jgi:ketosteroid isomerase-like protein
MAACYTDDVVFSDPAFGELRGRDASDMWRMLTTRAKDFSLSFDNVRADERTGAAHWVATYLFSQTGNIVVNDIQARFVFRDGKICEHHDSFDLWKLVASGAGFQRPAARLDAVGEQRCSCSGLEGFEGISGQSLIRSRLVPSSTDR